MVSSRAPAQLYANKHLRRGIPIVLGIIIFFNAALFVLGCIIAAGGYSEVRSSTSVRALLWFEYAFFPLLCLANTAYELHQRRKHLLRSQRIVITASISLVLWIMVLLLSIFITHEYDALYAVAQFARLVDWFFEMLICLMYISYLTMGSVALARYRKWGRHGAHEAAAEERDVDLVPMKP